MDKINVVWLEPGNQWDQNTFAQLLNNKMWLPIGAYLEHNIYNSFDDVVADVEGVIVVVPHKYYVDKIDWLNESIAKYKWVLYIGTGNEEAEFPIEKVQHPNMIVYYTTPHLTRTHLDSIKRVFGDGYPPNAKLLSQFKQEAYDKPIDLFFAGQVTHIRRELAIKALDHIKDNEDYAKVEYLRSQGFTQGFEPEEYYNKMASSKIVLCPSGPNTPDTFRTYEALEALSLPIIDTKTLYDDEPQQFWSVLFGEEPPFPIIRDDWDSLNGYAKDILSDWHTHINRAVSWWIAKKRQYAYEFVEDLDELINSVGKLDKDITPDEKITVLIVTSPIKSHPETDIIDQTIGDIRATLPNAEIIIGVDGVREEQAHYTDNYNEYKKRILWKSLHEWHNVLPVIFDEHLHQAEMVRRLLPKVKTPTILFVEHDTAITPDYSDTMPWGDLVKTIEDGDAYVVRFHHEAGVLPSHEHLMFKKTEIINGVPLRGTIQWSQRPHLASTAFYKDMINRYFTPESRTMIEDVIHGKVQEDYNMDGIQGWYRWRLWMYAPDGNMKRSYTTDGRKDDPKYEMKF